MSSPDASVRLDVGDQIPSVGLRATDGFLLNLRSFVTKQPVALLFFAGPTASGAQRAGGDALATALAKGAGRLAERGIAAVGITCDSEAQQRAYVQERSLPFLLMSDERRSAVVLLGIPTLAEGANHNVAPPVLVAVDREGLIRAVYHDPDPRTLVAVILETFRESAAA
ncbi:MAG: redoxin domain-containing protein [Candidatus Limnocylindria bacterium]